VELFVGQGISENSAYNPGTKIFHAVKGECIFIAIPTKVLCSFVVHLHKVCEF
jgi:hypothetical protein